MTKIEIKKGEIEMLWCFQNFDRKILTVFKKEKCILKTIARGKICTCHEREHLLYFNNNHVTIFYQYQLEAVIQISYIQHYVTVGCLYGHAYGKFRNL